MKIDVLCNDGSPLGIVEADVNGEIPGRLGIGGAELALMTMCAAWKFNGHDVTLYNNPRVVGASSFKQKHIPQFDPQEDRDVLVIFRSPNPMAVGAKGLKVWWSCDPATVGDFTDFAKQVDRIVTISPHHTKYFKEHYGIDTASYIDLPVRTWEYKEEIEKKPKQCMFTSIPDRGVMQLHAAWGQIVRQVPDANLVITSDWRLWSDWANEDQIRPFRLSFASLPNVSYLGAIRRPQLVKLQMESAILTYPCVYEEMFCIAVAEAQVAGALPVTSEYGALTTTNMGISLYGNPRDSEWIDRFVKVVVDRLNSPEKLKEEQTRLREMATKRFSIETVLDQWYKVFHNE